MDYRSFRFRLILRLLVLGLTIFVFSDLYYSDTYFFLKLLVFALIALQGYHLYQYLDKPHRALARFLEGVRNDDLTRPYPDKKTAIDPDMLHLEFDELLRKFREQQADKEARHQYLRTIVQHIGIGIITFDQPGEVQIFNHTAKKLLEIQKPGNISEFDGNYPAFLQTITDLKTGGRKLVKIKVREDEIQLAVYAIELLLQGKMFKLISLQNIQSELEEKEMEAWQNLIRVLTHEIMNSVTPIASLAATIESELDEFLRQDSRVAEIRQDQVKDFHLSVKTIHNRSEGLIKFVSDFRNMTRIKLPALEEVEASEIMDHVMALMKPDLERNTIAHTVSVQPGLTIRIDKEQIAQVVINLVKNAIQALEGNKGAKSLTITATEGSTGGALISIADNGTGIEEEALKKIFIPFFSTKKNGSGIGLSLSKQIMRNHGGSISARSQIGKGTELLLRFVR